MRGLIRIEIFLLVWLAFSAGAVIQGVLAGAQAVPVLEAESKPVKKTLVVLVHGTLMPDLTRAGLMEFMRERNLLNKSSLGHALMLSVTPWKIRQSVAGLSGIAREYWLKCRKKRLLHSQPLQELGLHPVVKNGDKNNVSSFFVRSYEEQHLAAHGSSEHLNFYTFGWSGMLSSIARHDAAIEFYQSLVAERNRLIEAGATEVKIVIIAHSHGGNVTLLLARQEAEHTKGLVVNKVVLFGIPVQPETHALVHSDLFKKVYSISSYGDGVQQSDFISTDGWGSRDIFTHKGESEKKNKLIQLKVSVNDIHPTHTELWFCAHPESTQFRTQFALHPLPIAVITPFIIKIASPYLSTMNHAHMVIDVNGQEGTMSLYEHVEPQGKLRGKKAVKRNLIAGSPLFFTMPKERSLPWLEPEAVA